MRWWERSIGGKRRGRIIALLRRSSRTVEEIATDLRVTGNAVRAQIQLLERGGMVHAVGTRAHDGAGKPASLYAIAPSAEATLSAAYAPVLRALLASMRDRLDPEMIDVLMRDTGKRLAPTDARKTSLEARVRVAASILTALGAELDVEKSGDGYLLRGYACPLSAVVRTQPRACLAVEELVSAIVGVPVRECCDRVDGARCRFQVSARPA